MDAKKKGHRRVFGATRTFLFSFTRGLRRRRYDVLGCGTVWSLTILGYFYATIELLQPADAPSVHISNLIGHVMTIFFVLNGLAVMWHGPGRVPKKLTRGQGWEPAPLVEMALEVGRHSPFRPFKGTEEWCFECNHWKAPLVHHCSVCNRCSLWMDHHCMMLGQCIGFRNMRCFILWLASGQLLMLFGILLTVQRLILASSFDWWLLGRLVIFDGILVYALRVANSHFRFVLLKVGLGWPSGVLHAKFTDIASYAHQIVHQYGDMPSASMQALQAAVQRIIFPSGGLRGLFYAEGRLGGLAVAFGEPPSWRWLLPLRPGGQGDPLKPTVFNEESCQAWADLDEALVAHHELMAQVQRLMAMREQVASLQQTAMLDQAQTMLMAKGPTAQDAFVP